MKNYYKTETMHPISYAKCIRPMNWTIDSPPSELYRPSLLVRNNNPSLTYTLFGVYKALESKTDTII